jgi:hypothetical protein
MSGGGVLTTAQGTARSASVAATGGGSATAEGTSADAHSGSFVATGGGVASIELATARLVALLASGAGGASFLWSSAHAGTLVGSGGGRAVVAGGITATPPDPGYAKTFGSVSDGDLFEGAIRVRGSWLELAGFTRRASEGEDDD